MTCCGQKGWSCALSCANVQKVVAFFFLWLIINRFGELDWHSEELPET